MTFSLDTTLGVPEFSAAVSGEVDANTNNPSKGTRLVAQTLQNLYVMKCGALVWEFFGPQPNPPLNNTADRIRRHRSRTQIQGELPTSLNNSAADVYLRVRRVTNTSDWVLTLTNVTLGTTLAAQVNGGAITVDPVAGDLWFMGTIPLDDVSDFNEFSLECTTSTGVSASSQIRSLSIIPRRSFVGNTLPNASGGYIRGVNPIEMDLIDDGTAATPSLMRDLNAMGLDIWRHRVGQIISSSNEFAWPGASSGTAHRFMAHAPAGVESATFWFRNGPIANQFLVQIVADIQTFEVSAVIAPNAWGQVTIGIRAPRWGGDFEFILSSTDADFEGVSGWWLSASYPPPGLFDPKA